MWKDHSHWDPGEPLAPLWSDSVKGNFLCNRDTLPNYHTIVSVSIFAYTLFSPICNMKTIIIMTLLTRVLKGWNQRNAYEVLCTRKALSKSILVFIFIIKKVHPKEQKRKPEGGWHSQSHRSKREKSIVQKPQKPIMRVLYSHYAFQNQDTKASVQVCVAAMPATDIWKLNWLERMAHRHDW